MTGLGRFLGDLWVHGVLEALDGVLEALGESLDRFLEGLGRFLEGLGAFGPSSTPRRLNRHSSSQKQGSLDSHSVGWAALGRVFGAFEVISLVLGRSWGPSLAALGRVFSSL